MNEEEKKQLFSDVDELLDIYKQYSPIQPDCTFVFDNVKNCIIEMAEFIIKDKTELKNLCDWMAASDFYTSPASTRFHGNFKSGLMVHSLKVVQQSLFFAKTLISSYLESPKAEKFTITAEDIFISALAHDFCKANTYSIEYRNTKDITGNWIKQPYYKTKTDVRSLGHGNESVLKILEVMPSLIKKRYVLEAISRHMGFSDLSESEGYNYSNFLENPLVVLLQLADEIAAQFFNC